MDGKGDDLETLTKQLVNAAFGGATNQGGAIKARMTSRIVAIKQQNFSQ